MPEPASRDLDATVATGTTSPTASTASTVPQVVLGASQALGTMAAADIERGVRARTAIFRACYDFGLRKVPKLEGAVSISYVITKTGGVRSVAVANETLGHKPTIACIMHGFTSARFTPRPKDEVTVTSPLTFVAPLAGAGTRAAH